MTRAPTIYIGAEPGIYQHYKGNFYQCLGVAVNPDIPHSEVVVYKPLYITSDGVFGRLTHRPLREWLEYVDGIPRFRRINGDM